MSICLTWFPIGGLGEPNIYHYLGDFAIIWNFTWRLSDCDEIEGVTHRWWCGWICEDYWCV